MIVKAHSPSPAAPNSGILRTRKGPTRAEAEKAASGLESLFLKMLVHRMRKNAESFGEGLFGKGPGSGIQSSLYDSLLAGRLADSKGTGLKEVLLRDWESKGWIPSEEVEADEKKEAGGEAARNAKTIRFGFEREGRER